MLTHHQVRAGAQGLRSVTPALLQAEEYARRWQGLPPQGSKKRLLQLLEDVPAERMGVSTAARDLLHWMVKAQPAGCFRSAEDLADADPAKAGLALISTWSDAYLAAAFDVHQRSLARWRGELASAGWVCFRDSPDRRRYRVGEPEAPEEAFGVDLRPLVARFEELETLRAAARDQVRALLALRKTLSCRRNRIRSLAALVVSDDCIGFIETALQAISRGIRVKDPDLAQLALAEADKAIARLESLVDTMVCFAADPTEESGAPDRTGAQFDPTHPSQISKQREETDDEGGYASRDLPSPPEEEEEEVLWQADDLGEPDGPVIEVTPQARRMATSSPSRVTCPTSQAVLKALPALLAARGLAFSSHPAFPTSDALAVAYGQSAASRLGLRHQAIRQASYRVTPLPFAVAALLSEFTPGIRDRKSYLLGLLDRMTDERIKVDLWASWQRLVRENAAPAAQPSLFTGQQSPSH